jgi:Zn-finger protein
MMYDIKQQEIRTLKPCVNCNILHNKEGIMEGVESLDVANNHRKGKILLLVCLTAESSPFSCPATGTS